MPSDISASKAPDDFFSRALDGLRGNWANPVRVKYLCLASGALMAFMFAQLLARSDGLTDSFGRLLGPDFSAFWAAGRAVIDGDSSSAYQLSWFVGHLRKLFGAAAYELAWCYPPLINFLVVPLAALPYTTALALWLGAAYGALALVVRKIVPHPLTWLAIACFPGFYGNALQGQIGFLVAALFGGALLALDRRPLLSGALFALMAIKPQYGVFVPIALAADRRWGAIVAAAGFGAVLAGLSALVFGVESWVGFFSSLGEMKRLLLESGRLDYYYFQTFFIVVRKLGAPLALAYALQGIAASVIVVVIWRLWRSGADNRLKYAALITGTMLASPYCMDYDLVLLAPAAAFLVSYGRELGFRPWEQTAIALALAVSPIARVFFFFLGLPIGLFATFLLFTFSLLHAAKSSTLAPSAA